MQNRPILIASRRSAALGVIALTLALAYGIWYSYSVVLVALLAEFGWSRSVLAGAFSVFTLVHGGVNPLVGALCARYGAMRVTAAGGALLGLALLALSFIDTPLELYLGFGVLTALAVAAAGWAPALVYVQREYRERVGLSVGIISSGVGVGMLLVVPLAQVLIDAFGWRTAYRVLAAVSVLWIVPASLWLMRASPEENRGRSPIKKNRGQSPIKQNQEESGSDPMRGAGSDPMHSMTLREAARTQVFWLLMGAFFFGNLSSQTLHVHQVAYLVDHGLSAIVGATVVGVVGAASIVGKTGGGWLSDRIERELVYVAGILIMVTSIFVLMALGAAPSAWGAYGYAVLLGLGYSVTAAITPLMVSDRFSGPHFGAIVGVGLTFNAVGSALGPWLAGRLYDATGTYTAAFLIAAACGLIAVGTGWRTRSLRKMGSDPISEM